MLWRTAVPGDVELPALDASSYVARAALEERADHDRVLRFLALGAIVVQLVALAVLASRPPRGFGPPLVRAAQLAVFAGGVAFAAALPFALGSLWWQRRHGIARVGYGQWLVDRLPALAESAVLLAFGAVVAVALARRLGRTWWLAAAPVFAAAGVAAVLLQPLLTPRLRAAPAELTARVQALGARQGLEDVEVEVRKAAKRTRLVNAEALGVGPTTRVILWDTALALRTGETEFLAAHELAHVSRAHLWKGLAWFALLLVPGLWLLARLVPLDDPRAVPRAVLVAVAIVLLVSPFANVVSRRYEAEADWVALETTRDPQAARGLWLDLSRLGLRHPDPPAWSQLVFGTHPSLLERIAMTEAWARNRRAARSPAGS